MGNGILNFFFRKEAETKILLDNSKWVFIANSLGAGLAFLRSVAIARGLGADIYGTYVIVVAFTGFVLEMLNLNLSTAIIKFGAGFIAEKRLDKLTALLKISFRVSAVTAGIAVAMVAILISVSYSTFIEKPGLTWFIIAFTIASGVSYFNTVARGSLRLFFKFRTNSIMQVIMDVVETIVIVGCVFFYRHNIAMFFIAAIITRFLNSFICNLMAFAELKKELLPHIHVSEKIIAEEKIEIRKFAIGNSIGSTLKTMMSQGDILLLGALSNPATVAFYSVAKKLAYAVLTITDPLTSAIFPQFAKLLAEKKYPDVKKLVIRIVSLASIPAVTCLVAAFFLNSWIIVTVFGKEYTGAVSPFYFHVINAVMGALVFWALPLFQALGLHKLRLKIYSVAIVFGTLAAVLLVPVFYATGMAISYLLLNVIVVSSLVYFGFRKMNSLT